MRHICAFYPDRTGRHEREFCIVKKRWDIGDEDTIRSGLILHIEKKAAGPLGMTRTVQDGLKLGSGMSFGAAAIPVI
jgi:hypothetical protein